MRYTTFDGGTISVHRYVTHAQLELRNALGETIAHIEMSHLDLSDLFREASEAGAELSTVRHESALYEQARELAEYQREYARHARRQAVERYGADAGLRWVQGAEKMADLIDPEGAR